MRRHPPKRFRMSPPDSIRTVVSAVTEPAVRFRVDIFWGASTTVSPSSRVVSPTRVRLADLKLDRLLDRFDAWAETGVEGVDGLELRVLDDKGRLPHDGGVIPKSPGLYVMGTSLLRRRRSTYLRALTRPRYARCQQS